MQRERDRQYLQAADAQLELMRRWHAATRPVLVTPEKIAREPMAPDPRQSLQDELNALVRDDVCAHYVRMELWHDPNRDPLEELRQALLGNPEGPGWGPEGYDPHGSIERVRELAEDLAVRVGWRTAPAPRPLSDVAGLERDARLFGNAYAVVDRERLLEDLRAREESRRKWERRRWGPTRTPDVQDDKPTED